MFLFILYLVVLVYFLFFAEAYGRTLGGRVYRYNLEPLKEIKRFWIYREELGLLSVLTNLVGNVVAFIPFGAILPVIKKGMRRWYIIILLSFEFSFIVETIQLISKVGSFDVDDLILNTLGGTIGYLIFYFCNKLRRKLYG
ncbi:MAG TPA: VanZ family protein [Candidatus Merdenecus merdavium]|nr:VanZ family protein [Candidatus Merdenecus merdavium]